MSSTIADGVLAATHKLVQQAMSGQWQEVPRTVRERRELLTVCRPRPRLRTGNGSARFSRRWPNPMRPWPRSRRPMS